MNTTLERACPVSSHVQPLAARTCSTISAVDRLRVSPPCPVAQNGQAMPQPACEEMHTVFRCGYRISTDSNVVPSTARHNVFRVSPASHWMSRAGSSNGGNIASATVRAPRRAGRSSAADRRSAVRSTGAPVVCPKCGQFHVSDGVDASGFVEVGEMPRHRPGHDVASISPECGRTWASLRRRRSFADPGGRLAKRRKPRPTGSPFQVPSARRGTVRPLPWLMCSIEVVEGFTHPVPVVLVRQVGLSYTGEQRVQVRGAHGTSGAMWLCVQVVSPLHHRGTARFLHPADATAAAQSRTWRSGLAGLRSLLSPGPWHVQPRHRS